VRVIREVVEKVVEKIVEKVKYVLVDTVKSLDVASKYLTEVAKPLAEIVGKSMTYVRVLFWLPPILRLPRVIYKYLVPIAKPTRTTVYLTPNVRISRASLRAPKLSISFARVVFPARPIPSIVSAVNVSVGVRKSP